MLTASDHEKRSRKYRGFVRQVFITTRSILFFSAENVALHLPLEAAARHERRLARVALLVAPAAVQNLPRRSTPAECISEITVLRSLHDMSSSRLNSKCP